MTAKDQLEKIEALKKLLATSIDIDDEIDWLKAQQKIFTQKAVDFVGGEQTMRRLISAARDHAKAQSEGAEAVKPLRGKTAWECMGAWPFSLTEH
jgi:hypothetical protein